jgi:putative mRNA 3-end processing factor
LFEQFLTYTDSGLYSPVAGCHIDAWKPVDKVLITHAHADHARQGHGLYLTAKEGAALLSERVGEASIIEPVPYNHPIRCGDAWISFHPAGHILGSAQVCIEYAGQRVVVSGDYKRAIDQTCAPFESQLCDLFVTEATFALPVYAWPVFEQVMSDITEWWQQNATQGKTSILFCYALGKAQRILNGLIPFMPAMPLPFVYGHASILTLNQHYRMAQVPLCDVLPMSDAVAKAETLNKALILAYWICQWVDVFAFWTQATRGRQRLCAE